VRPATRAIVKSTVIAAAHARELTAELREAAEDALAEAAHELASEAKAEAAVTPDRVP
jgi:hypothetical protein